ncbi:hypothetical protein NDK47_14880 [Brevibacillus ruminantium]|uniref:Uncharacterized protein n=1 Tax=Brevibacillus ruminantium TaxID=2950604 RepID=A0ABY4W8F7_9BACL|nr:hypothetical protein [Brevibacillus ruminantium]USG63462.1 hypothetical protein NDK47_14880 [Brevibacillus ruminantium]
MDKRKKGEGSHWITPIPGLFSGEIMVEEAVERVTSIKREEVVMTTDGAQWRLRAEEMQQELAALKEKVTRWEEQFKALQDEQKREREYLYQVVLSLKQEWERERSENRDH